MDAAIVTSSAKSSKSCSSSRVHSRLQKWVSGSFVSNALPLKKNSLMQWRVTRGNFTGKQINLKYTERILRDRLPANIQEQSADNLCTFQHDGAPCHKTWSEVCRNLETLDSWAGKFPCRNLTQNLWSVVGRGEADKATNRLKRWSGKNGSNKSWQWTKCGDWTGS